MIIITYCFFFIYLTAWKYVKLMEVTVSPDPDDPHMSGSVALVKDGYVVAEPEIKYFTLLKYHYI